MATLVRNTSGSVVTLPDVYGERILADGQSIIIADTPASVGGVLSPFPVNTFAITECPDGQSDAIQPGTHYAGTASFQTLPGDLTVLPAAGKNVPNTAFLAGAMGNLLADDPLTKTGNYLGGVIGHYSVPGAKATSYPAGGVLAGIGDGSTTADGAVVAYVDGDSALTKADAMFKVMCNNSTPGSGADFGLDLQDAAHDGYLPVDAAFYKKAQVRLTEDVCTLVGSGAPTDGVAGTGAGNTGKGSEYVDSASGERYLNTGTKASPTWKLITHA